MSQKTSKMNFSIASVVLMSSFMLVVSSCAFVQSPVSGFLYTDVNSGIAVTANTKGEKVGQACSQTVLGWFATGDSSIDTARRNGGVTSIVSVDAKAWSILGVYGKYCTIVRGN